MSSGSGTLKGHKVKEGSGQIGPQKVRPRDPTIRLKKQTIGPCAKLLQCFEDERSDQLGGTLYSLTVCKLCNIQNVSFWYLQKTSNEDVIAGYTLEIDVCFS